MNTVHEPGPTVTLKISSVRKSVQKAKPDAQAPSKPSRHAQVCTGAPRRAHGCRVVAVSPAVSWQGAGRVVGQCGRVAATVPLTCRARAGLLRLLRSAFACPACCRGTRAPASVLPSAPAPMPPARNARAAHACPPASSTLPARPAPACPAPQYNNFFFIAV